MNLETTERFEEEMMDFGLRSIRDYTYGTLCLQSHIMCGQ